MPCPLAILVCRGSDCEKRSCDAHKKGGVAFFRACETALADAGLADAVPLKATKCQDHCKDGRIVLVRHDGVKTTLAGCNTSETAGRLITALLAPDGWPALENNLLSNVKARRKAEKKRKK